MMLIAYDKKTGSYVDSITPKDKDTELYFYQDFKDCRIERVIA